MTRDQIKSLYELGSKVTEALSALPYRDAAPAMRALDEMLEVVSDDLPGGYYGNCIFCEEVKGEDEMVDYGDERICTACFAKREDPVEAA